MKNMRTEAYVKVLTRGSLFIIFFWFGLLKVLGVSPAHDLVVALTEVTLPFISPGAFLIALGLIEMAIGVLFLFPKWTKYALPVLLVHMFTTFGPLVFLPDAAWQSFLVPTLVGQYILKNLALIALAFAIYIQTVHAQERK